MLSRPASRLPALPQIKHPLAEMVPAYQLTGINTSRSGDMYGRPLPAEERPSSRPRSNLFNRRYSLKETDNPCAHKNVTEREYTERGAGQDCVDAEVLSPYVGDRGYREIKTPSDRGVSRNSQNRGAFRAPSSRGSTRADLRLEVDELESIVRGKCRNNQTDVQKKFRDNDPQGHGDITKEALLRVVVMLAARPVSHLLFERILVRFGLENQTRFSYADFIERSNTMPGNPASYPSWITSLHHSYRGDKSQLTATQAHTVLKEKAKQRALDMFSMVPQTNPDGARRLLKPEFRTALAQQLQVNMSDEEFERLWQRYDEQNVGVIDSKILNSKLGIHSDGRATPKPEDQTNCLRRKEVERERSLDIERWLKNKFRQGFHDMKSSFKSNLKSANGMIPAGEFCNILEKYGLRLSVGNLDEFLSRCGVVQTRQGVPYLSFLKMFQDRSELGVTHKILADSKHRYNQSIMNGDDVMSTMSALESQLMNMFQRDFLSLLGTFHTLDEHRQGYITQEKFRGAIENAFDIHLSDEQLDSLLDHVPLNQQGCIKYPEFMAQFDTRGEAQSLMSGSVPGGNIILEELDLEHNVRRNVSEVAEMIRQLLTSDFGAVEERFSEQEAYSSQRITQESLYYLLRQFDIRPPITRGEIRDLWETILTNKDNTLSWVQFISQFGFTGQTHTYPNSSKNPPKLGDSDYSLRSKKFNSDYEIILDGTRQKVEYRWEDLRRCFVALDPHKTSCVSDKEFENVVNEICVHLSVYDLKQIMQRHAVNDSRVNYVNFLSEFGPKREVWHTGNDMFSLLTHPKTPFGIADIVEHPQKGLIGISAKLRNKLSGSWKNLRRAFQKMDKNGSGYLPLAQFRSVLQLANIVLDEDEVYHVMSQLDQDLTGRLDYNKFLGELFRPLSQRSSRSVSRQSGLLPLSRQSARRSAIVESRAARSRQSIA